MKKIIVALTLIVGVASFSKAADLTFTKSIINGVVTSTSNYDLDLDTNGVDLANVQVNFSSASPSIAGVYNSTINFVDGTPSTGTITVTEGLNGVTTSYATNVIWISSGPGAIGASLAINVGGLDYPAKDGSGWFSATVSSNSAFAFSTGTAVSICNFLNNNYGTFFKSTVTAAGNVIVSTAATPGATQNNWYITSSTQAAMSSSTTFKGGVDNATIKIAGFSLTVNTGFFAPQYSSGTVSSTATATSLATGLTSDLSKVNSTFGGKFLICQALGSVVTCTSTVVGTQTNYTFTTSSATALAISSNVFIGGTDSDITWAIPAPSTGSIGTPTYPNYSGIYPIGSTKPLNSIGKATTQFGTGLPLLFVKSSGTIPTPLADKTTYYATGVTPSSFKLALTSTDAIAGNAITISTVQINGNGSFQLQVIPISTGTVTWNLLKSNDDINFSPVFTSTGGFITAIPIASPASAAAGSTMYDLGVVSYRWLRFQFINGTWGGMNFNVLLNGKAYGKSQR